MKENLIAGRSALGRAKTGKEFNCGVVYTPDDIARGNWQNSCCTATIAKRWYLQLFQRALEADPA
jgi:hypothetical protein